MTKPNDSDFYLQVKDFILSAGNHGRCEDTPEENEIRLFLLTLLNHFKHQEEE